MSVDRAELRERLAARYVLGVQTAAVRRRMRAHSAVDFALRRTVARWELQLSQLSQTVAPATPSDLTWARISATLQIGTRQPRRAAANRFSYLAAASVLLAVITSVGWWQSAVQPPQTVTNTVIQRVPETITVALVSNERGEALWLTSVRPQSRQLAVQVINPPEQRSDRDYQLWLLTADGTPLSLGLLPQSGSREYRFDDAALAALDTSELLAVSLEPAGGSPQAGPTGPVLFTAALLTP
jgi:anti-sigma-K factor RskA